MVFPLSVVQIILAELVYKRKAGKDHDAEGQTLFQEMEKKDTGLAGAAPHLEKTTIMFFKRIDDFLGSFALIIAEMKGHIFFETCVFVGKKKGDQFFSNFKIK